MNNTTSRKPPLGAHVWPPPGERWERGVKIAKGELPPLVTALFHYLVLRDGGRGFWPSVPTIAEDLNQGRATIFKGLRVLQDRNWIEVFKAAEGKATHYRFTEKTAARLRGERGGTNATP